MPGQNQALLDALNGCIAACEACVTDCCSHGQNTSSLGACLLLCRDCSDFCAVTARFTERGSQHAQHLLRECVEICNACADECEKHSDMASCKACAEACRRCVQACSGVLQG